MTGVRMDCNGQALFRGEYLRKDGRYEYRYVDRYGKTKWIYANRLSELRGEEA
ncbi:MAG: integrase DNA-binding domain-containing protein [Butyrivibrio sp.]|nr:integrase DNA-binding domain-containing protein [Butyrivibrio sp.]